MIQTKQPLAIIPLMIFLSFVVASFSVKTASASQKPITIEGKKYLPLRVLSRAFSTIYSSNDVKSQKLQGNVPAFQAFFVYEKKMPQSDLDTLIWYQVGTDNRGHIVGWMNSDDVFEWKQTMCLSYSHPEGRHPVLMFDTRENLQRYASLPAQQRKEAVENLYNDIDKGDVSSDFPVVTVEPKMAVDITKEFYLLPILAFKDIEIDNREARLLQLAAVTKGSKDARESSDIRKNSDYLKKAIKTSAEAAHQVAQNLIVDVVWVMDTTNSMQPYIDQTLDIIRKASARLSSDAKTKNALHFGIWGYRDSMDIPGIGYDVKNYTQDLQDINSFSHTLQQVKAVGVGSQGYAEDMFSGINSAISDTAWTPGAMRIIILVGDAPSHEPGHKWNISRQNAETLRKLAKEQNITIMAIHIKDPQAEKYHELTEEQFSTLSQNPGVQAPTYLPTRSDDRAGFEKVTKDVTDTILGLVTQAKNMASISTPKNSNPVSDEASATGEISSINAAIPNGSGTPSVGNLDLLENTSSPKATDHLDADANSRQLVRETVKAAFVQWLGSQAGAQAPRDVVAWVTDKDLIDSEIQALEVRLLINKRQLDSLRETLSMLLKAGRSGQISGDDFFSSLQAAAASTARDPDMIKRAKSLAQTGLLPEFLQGLPYTSRIMDMTNELWNSWSVDDQDMFLSDLEARIMAYETIHDSPEGWVKLNKDDDPGDYVYPITLDLLP